MAAVALTERHATNLPGVLPCFDRINITGKLPDACHPGGMTSSLYQHGIRIFDYAQFADPLRDRIRQRAQEVCAAAGIEIEHVNKNHIRKEELVARVLRARGDAPGLVHVVSAMEGCPSYKPWHDKASGKTFLRPELGKSPHHCFYFIDEEFGLCYLRVPTWAPFVLQFCCNGHSALAIALKREGIDFAQESNAFFRVADVARVQTLADRFDTAEQVRLRALQRGVFHIDGWRRADLLARLDILAAATSRQLKRLGAFGQIKKVAHTYRHYLTGIGRAAIAGACSLTRFNIVPAMAAAR